MSGYAKFNAQRIRLIAAQGRPLTDDTLAMERYLTDPKELFDFRLMHPEGKVFPSPILQRPAVHSGIALRFCEECNEISLGPFQA